MLVRREKEWWWVGKRSEVVRLGNEVVVFGIVQGQPCKRIMQNQLSMDNHLWKIMQNFPYMVWQVVWTANGWLQWLNIPNHGTMLMSELLPLCWQSIPNHGTMLMSELLPLCWQSIPNHGTMLMSELLHCVDKIFPIMEQCLCPSFSILCCSGCGPIFDSA
jgi:hypothetical protein